MNVFQDFNNLWHDDNLFDNLFKNVWDFNNLLHSAVNRNDLLLESINNLELFLDLISNVSLQDEVVFLYNLVSMNDNFLDLGGVLFNSDDLFLN